jgi:hypothetical protein
VHRSRAQRRQLHVRSEHPVAPQPVNIDTVAASINDVAGPTTTQCVAIDGSGNAITFTPGSPAASLVTSLDPGDEFGLISISCATPTQCTAISNTKAVTFNPASPAGATPQTIEPSGLVDKVACPLSTQCTAVDELGRAR